VILRARTLLALTLLVGLLGAPSTSWGDDLATEQAKLHNEAAKKLFNLGLFREAAEEYQKAYQAKPLPAFLFNLGQCYKRMASAESLRKSIFYFKSYLRNDPETPARAAIQKEIERLEVELRVAEKPQPRPLYKKWWFWTIIGVAVTGAVVGTVVGTRPENDKPVPGSIGTFGVP